MKFLVTLVLLAVLALPVLAQINPPLPADIVSLGQTYAIVGDDSCTVSPARVGGRMVMPAGLIVWAQAPFRYRPTYLGQVTDLSGDGTKGFAEGLTTQVADTTEASPAKDGVLYQVNLVLPGAYKLRAIASADTVYVRPYYR